MVVSRSMRILWVREGRLLPVQSGGMIRSYYTLRELGRRHEVTLVSVYRAPGRDAGYEDALTREFPGSHAIYAGRPIAQGSLSYIRNRLGRRTPANVGYVATDAARALLQEWMDDSKFDIAVADALTAAPNFPSRANTPFVLFEHNVESALLRIQAGQAKSASLPWRLLLRLQARRLRRYEAAVVRRAAHVIAVSEEDAAQLRVLGGHERVSSVATGVDLEQFASVPAQPDAAPLVMFTGLMEYAPNIDAALFFVHEIWPNVTASVPAARFRIVGRAPGQRVQALAREGIEVTGTVDSIAAQLAQASVVVVPLRAGSGTRLKIYEAMAMAKPVVSTHIGAEGLDVHDGSDIILEDDPRRFAAHVVRLLNGASERRAIGAAAEATARQYGWPTVTLGLEQVLQDVLRQEQRLPVPGRR